MRMGIILSAIFIPVCVVSVLAMMRRPRYKTGKKASDEEFVVMLPETVLFVGILGDLVFAAVILAFTLFSADPPHLIFYLVFGGFFWLSTYLILKTLCFKVIVRDERIMVSSVFRKKYTFTFFEIVSVVRQVKKSQRKSERVIVKTATGKRLVVEDSEISYSRFLKKIKETVNNKYLVGF